MRKTTLILTTLFCFSALIGMAQTKYFTRTGKIQFTSKATMEDIQATNKTVTAVLDSKTGAIQFSVQMKGFEFEKELMQQHFNDSYAESDKYPKSEFKGTITNNSAINYKKDGSYTASIKGQLTMHGVTKEIVTTAVIRVSGNQLNTTASFTVPLSDYRIKIPAVVKDKVSGTITILVDCKLQPLK